MPKIVPLVVAVVLGGPAIAQDYGGGWAVPSLDTAAMIGQQVIASELGVRAAGGTPGRGRTPADANAAEPVTLFASALQPTTGTLPTVRTSFTRSPLLQKQSEAAILAEVKRHQPGAEVEYAAIFAKEDMARLFDRATSQYGLRSDDVADTMTAYWLVSWVVANDAKDFSPAAARAVREQVRAGIARTSVAGLSPEQKHRLADEAIFNTLVLTAIFQNREIGKVSAVDYRRVADATQTTFTTFGANLRALRLTDAGFSSE